MKKPHNIFCVVWIHRFLHTIWQDVSVRIKATEADFGYGHNVLIAVVQLMEIYGPVRKVQVHQRRRASTLRPGGGGKALMPETAMDVNKS